MSWPPVTLMITPRAPCDRRAFEQRARNGRLRRLDRPVLAGHDAGAHHRHAHARHDRLHVGEVEVDETGHEDEIRDALNGLPQHVVGRRERLGQRRRAIDDRQQPLVRDRDDRVDALAQRRQPALGLGQPLLAFELERLGDDRHRQRAELAGEARDDGRGAGAGAAAEPGRDEHHVGAGQRLNQAVGVFERGLAADVRIGAGAEAFGELRADLNLDRRRIALQRLHVGVGDDELDAFEPDLHHPVDGVAAAAADADDLDARARAAFHRPASNATGFHALLPFAASK